MTKRLKNAFKATGVLAAITAVCVAVLAVCNMFFPKYKPTLDVATCSLINGIFSIDAPAEESINNGDVIMLDEGECGEAFADFNKRNKGLKGEVLAVYALPKIEGTPFVIESKAKGRDADIVILTAYIDGKVFGAVVKKQSDGYWDKLPADMLSDVVGTSDKVDLAKDSERLASTGATLSLNGVSCAVSAANIFAREHGADILGAIEARQPGGEK